MNSQTVTVNLIPNMSSPPVVNISQGDIGRPIRLKVLDGTTISNMLEYGMTAKIEGTKPSGLGFSETATIESSGIISFETTEAMTQEAGLISTEIKFSKTGFVIGTANFILAVEPSPHPEGTTDGTQETMANLETRLQGQIDALDSRIDAIEGDQSIIDDIDALDARVTALEQGGSGLSQTEKNLILTLFSKAAYAEDDASTAYDALEAMWASTTKTITYNLTDVMSSNTQTSIESGQIYTTALAVRQGYTLNTVTVTMGGVDITSTAYSSGMITIPSVTGNLVITATAVLAAQSITATYTQSGTVYTTDSLDSLKADLVVTANYSGGTSETISASNYTLSGTLTVGTSTITVSYAGLTDTFDVTVSSAPVTYLYNWDLTQSLVDSVSGREVSLGAASGVSNATRDSNGLSFNAATQYAYFGEIDVVGKTIEIDVANFEFKGNTAYHIRFLSNSQYTTATSYGLGAIVWKKDAGWSSYGWSSQSTSSTTRAWSASMWSAELTGTTPAVINAFSGKTVKIVYHSDEHTKDLYLDNNYVGTIDDVYFNTGGSTHLSNKIYIAGMGTVTQSSGDQCYDMTITGVRVYANDV